MKDIKVYELKTKVYLLKDIGLEDMLTKIAAYIDTLLIDKKWAKMHRKNMYKNYCFNGFSPKEIERVYKKENIYTFTIRTIDAELARYFTTIIGKHRTDEMVGLSVSLKIIPHHFIENIHSCSPVIQKNKNGYWKNNYNVNEYGERLFANAIKKYNQYTGQKLNEKFQLYTAISFRNNFPLRTKYKNIHILGDSVSLQVADNPIAQEISYFLLGTGICEMNARGYGFVDAQWI